MFGKGGLIRGGKLAGSWDVDDRRRQQSRHQAETKVRFPKLEADVIPLVSQWLRLDRDPDTHAAIEQMSIEGDNETLRARLGKRIAFGTAGLRGPMQAGFACMNSLTVGQATRGLAVALLRKAEDQSAERAPPAVVVGFDGRHHSRAWARLAAAIFTGAGIRVHLFDCVVATPLVPFGVLFRKAAAGVMVTASHNPKQDNGYKVYWDNGCQIVEPIDRMIAAAINEFAEDEPWPRAAADERTAGSVAGDVGDGDLPFVPAALASARQAGLLIDGPGETEAIAKGYFNKIGATLCYRRSHNQAARPTDFPIVFTAMHGVGKRWVERAFAEFDLPPYIPVAAQIEPNPEFPTVRFPNPEEGAGALALSFATADAVGARLVLANDPDSDRLAVAERKWSWATQPEGTEGGDAWRVFTGNEIGALLADWSLQRYLEAHPDADRSSLLMVNSTVSSKMLQAICDKEGVRYEDTLTGFKWIGSRALTLQRDEQCHFVFGFEEAIGFMIGDTCFDKDGVRAAAVCAEMALDLQRQTPPRSLAQHYAELQQRYGYFESCNGYFFCYDPAIMASVFSSLRSGGDGGGHVNRAGPDHPVAHVRDLTLGTDTRSKDGRATLPSSSSSHMITFYFDDGSVATLRGSGTEPKLKYYIESKSDENAESARSRVRALADAIIQHWLRPEENGLVAPNAESAPAPPSSDSDMEDGEARVPELVIAERLRAVIAREQAVEKRELALDEREQLLANREQQGSSTSSSKKHKKSRK